MSFLGIDIGGANLKISSEDRSEIIYFPMWRRFQELRETLKLLSKKYGAKKVGVVMTAELADVFESKAEGVLKIAEVCKEVFDDVRFLDVNGDLYADVYDPLAFAASNWVASTKFLLSEGYNYFLFVDMGSTTTDLIPVTEKIEASKSDFERLKRRELIYIGILRTPVFYILRSFDSIPLCPEFFAITADVFRVTGDISENEYSCDTPDGKGKDVEACLKRLARTVCCDINELGQERAKEIAYKTKGEMVKILSDAIEEKINEYELKEVLACGLGEFLIEEACKKIGIKVTKLSEIYGNYSYLFPAFAMMKLVEKE